MPRSKQVRTILVLLGVIGLAAAAYVWWPRSADWTAAELATLQTLGVRPGYAEERGRRAICLGLDRRFREVSAEASDKDGWRAKRSCHSPAHR